MKELVMKKRSELEVICHKTHIEPDPSTAPEKSTALIDSGLASWIQIIICQILSLLYFVFIVIDFGNFLFLRSCGSL